MPDDAVILFAHGAKSPEWEKPIRSLAETLAAELAQTTVTLAFLQFGDPKLPDAIDELIGKGVKRFVFLPYFLAAGGHLLRDLPKMVDEARGKYPHAAFHVAHPLGEDPEVIEGLKRASMNFVKKTLGGGRPD